MSRITIIMLIFVVSNFARAEPQSDLFKDDNVLNKEIALAKKIISKQRNEVVLANMEMSVYEEKKFLGVYNAYRDEMKPIFDKKTKLIVDYADTYVKGNLTDKQALEFVKTFLDLKSKKTALRIKYVEILSEEISPKHIARFIQLENKLDAVLNYELARGVPLVPVK